MVWATTPDDFELITISVISEGFGTIDYHTFPASAHVGDSISGAVGISNNGDAADTFRVIVTRQDTFEVILDDPNISLDVTVGSESISSTPFILPVGGVQLLIETFHME